MKSVIEGSVYLLIMTLFFYSTVQFIVMNEKVTKVNEMSSYVENYVEALGHCKTDEDGNILYYKYDESNNLVLANESDIQSDTVKTFPVLQEDLVKQLKEAVKKVGFDIDLKYIDKTNTYVYIDYSVTYTLSHPFFGYKKEHTYSGLARCSLL